MLKGQVAVLRLRAASASNVTDAAYSCVREVYVLQGTKHSRVPRKRRTAENSVTAKFTGIAHLPLMYIGLRTSDSLHKKFCRIGPGQHPRISFSALGRSFFDGGAPTQTRVHRSDGQCQRIRLRHLLYPATTCSTTMQGRRLWDSLLLPYC
jgi:hypothetical protein